MLPVKASGWLNSNLSTSDLKTLIKSGITPVNDIFYSLWGNNNPINLLFGGYGSGKSVFIQTDLLEKSMQPGYFKCYYGRKVLEDVRGSIHSKFISIIKENGLENDFSFSEEPNGSMVIKNRRTGNLFLPFGASKPESLKSIDDPTHFFLEEMDQFTQNDFALILSRLRTEKSTLQLYGAFNTATVFPDHWILKVLFPELSESTEETKELIELINFIGVTKLFCNYTDNFFINKEDYYNKLKLTAVGDDELLKAIANGEWGTFKGVNPFAHQYKPEKHESKEAVFDPTKQIIIHIDFNIDPFAVGFSHIWRDSVGVHDHQFDEMSIENGSIDKMINKGKESYGRYLQSALLTGDAMGKIRQIGERDNASLYKQLLRGWGMSETQLRVKGNPTHVNSRADVNYLLLHHPDFKINPVSCPQTCRDFRTVQCDSFGEIIKRNRKEVNQKSDFLDNSRYKIHAFWKQAIEQHQKSGRW